MTAKAMISTGWRVRLGGMAAMFVGFCAFFLYDGFVGYPKQREIHDQFVAFSESHKDKNEVQILALWDEHAAQNGLPPSGKEGKEIKSMDKSDGSILTQKVLGFLLIPISAMMVLAWFQTFNRWVAVDENGVTSSAGQNAPWASMTKLDKLRWPKKGIAFLHYEDADKRIGQKILLDDFKFDRIATEQIVRAIEDHLKDEQIVGDIRESERDKRKAAKAAESASAVSTSS